MRPRLSFAALGFAVIGLGASIASLIDYLGADPTFCAETGCATVRASAWAHPLGIPMPLLGIAFFAAAIALSFVEAPRLRRALAVAGGAWALLLIVLQATAIGAWCKLCLVADPSAILYALAVLAGAGALRPSLPRGLALAPALAAVVGALAFATHAPARDVEEHARHAQPGAQPDAVPDFVRAALHDAPAGTATVVEVVDFECPFCRRMQQRLTEAMSRARHAVRVVRKMMPLSMHPHAMIAALAYCCADAQGKGEQMAEALFATAPDDLTAERCERIAAAIGCDLDRYRRDRPAAEARIAAEAAAAQAAGIRALPTMFVGTERIIGARASVDDLVAMLDRAAI